MQIFQPIDQKMENEKEIADHEDGIDRQLDEQRAHSVGGFFSAFEPSGLGHTPSSLVLHTAVAPNFGAPRISLRGECFFLTLPDNFPREIWQTQRINILKT